MFEERSQGMPAVKLYRSRHFWLDVPAQRYLNGKDRVRRAVILVLGCADCDRGWCCHTGAAGRRVGLITSRRRLVAVDEVSDADDCGCSRVEVVIVVDLSAAFCEDRTYR